MLRYYSSFMKGDDLKKLYCGFVRSVIEYSSVTYGPLLTKYQSNDLENIQKRCLKCLYGYDKSYTELLSLSGLSTLEERRNTALVKFAEKTLAIPSMPLGSQKILHRGNRLNGTLNYLKKDSLGPTDCTKALYLPSDAY